MKTKYVIPALTYHRAWIRTILSIGMLYFFATGNLSAQGIDAKKVREATLHGVVIITPNPRGENGSGFLINNQGYILTNVHVIQNRDSTQGIQIRFADNTSVMCDSIIYEDAARDIAILKITPQTNRRTLPMIAGGNVSAGDAVVAFGNPNNIPFNITQGIVSNLSPLPQLPFYLAYDAATNPGNSGGPLLNRFGQVVGMVAARIDRDTKGRAVQNFNLAIKASALREALSSIGISFQDTILVADENILREERLTARQDSVAEKQQAKLDSIAEAQRLAERREWERNTPTRLVAKAGGAISPHLGTMVKNNSDEYDWTDPTSRFMDFWQANLMFGLRTGVNRPGDRGIILGAFIAVGRMPSLNTLQGNPLYGEGEIGFVFGEYLRVSGGFGIQDVGYYTGTLGYTLNLLDFFTLDATLTGCFADKIILRAQLGAAIRIDFAKW
jgi:V8-like Glu-specific endopeptidase